MSNRCETQQYSGQLLDASRAISGVRCQEPVPRFEIKDLTQLARIVSLKDVNAFKLELARTSFAKDLATGFGNAPKAMLELALKLAEAKLQSDLERLSKESLFGRAFEEIEAQEHVSVLANIVIDASGRQDLRDLEEANKAQRNPVRLEVKMPPPVLFWRTSQ